MNRDAKNQDSVKIHIIQEKYSIRTHIIRTDTCISSFYKGAEEQNKRGCNTIIVLIITLRSIVNATKYHHKGVKNSKILISRQI